MFEILGFEKISFTNTETGQYVEGVKFHLLGDSIEQNGSGNSVFSKFIPTNKITGVPKVGAILEFKVKINSQGKASIGGASIA